MTDSKPAVDAYIHQRALLRLVNPAMRRLIARGVAGNHILVLHYTGHRTGRHHDVPAGYHVIDGVPLVLTDSVWRHNFAGGRHVEVTLRGKRRPARAVLVDDPDTVAELYDRLTGQFGLKQAPRRLGIRLNVQRRPTKDELREMVKRSGLSIVRVEPRE